VGLILLVDLKIGPSDRNGTVPLFRKLRICGSSKTNLKEENQTGTSATEKLELLLTRQNSGDSNFNLKI
jgi:hypothetical protein